MVEEGILMDIKSTTSMPDRILLLHYKHCNQMYMRTDKLCVRQDLTYTKFAGFFFGVSLLSMYLEARSIIDSYLIVVLVTGIGVLCGQLMNMIFLSPDLDRQKVLIREEGCMLEQDHASTISAKFLTSIKNASSHEYTAVLFTRLGPFIAVGICTICASTTLSLRVNTGFAVSIGLASVGTLLLAAIALGKCLKKYF